MKRYALLAVLSTLLVAGAFAATRLTINPSEMKNGETKSFTDDGRKITVTRDGDTTRITIEGTDGTRNLSITSDGKDIRIERDGLGGRRMIITPEFRGLESLPRFKMRDGGQTWFVCPKDHTMMRVPQDKGDQTFKCPVDGTTMEKRKGHGFAFFFDDDLFQSHDL